MGRVTVAAIEAQEHMCIAAQHDRAGAETLEAAQKDLDPSAHGETSLTLTTDSLLIRYR